MRSQVAERLVPTTIVRLDEHDVHLTETARAKGYARKLIGAIRWLAIPIIISQALQFGSFMYEECLQAAGFAASQMINAQDQAFAYDGVKSFERLMKQAQDYQRKYGQFAFWTAPPFNAYFEQAAPIQLAGMYAHGKKLGLWDDDVRRFTEVIDRETGKLKTVDTMKMSPIERLKAWGFNPEIQAAAIEKLEEMAQQGRKKVTGERK